MMPQRAACSSLRRIAILFAILALTWAAGDGHACQVDARPVPPLVMAAGAAALKEGRPVRILAIGSSSTAGVGASRPEANYPSQLAHRLVEAWGEGSVEIVNAGVSGESAPGTLRRLEAFLAAPPAPDLVLWQVGTNDVIFGGDPARLSQLVGRGLDAIAAAGAAALVIDQQYFPAILDLDRYEAFVAAVGAAASERGVALLPRYVMMKQWAAQDPAAFRATLSWDRFHLNDAGYACLAEIIAAAVIDAVRPPPVRPAPAKR
ncbi:SGNH/GDSL hydrolase family protein [Xanthobacter sp. AM11]|uniref:SGNH/GDSL hydrolase family protein n=1 Tax=Xanthobacter sp. AM11 TaxID=3380643 RepID=UPI0039BEE2DF